jgi:hypothetical protein
MVDVLFDPEDDGGLSETSVNTRIYRVTSYNIVLFYRIFE